MKLKEIPDMLSRPMGMKTQKCVHNTEIVRLYPD